jgi:phospholipid transport system substrate-binding protein
MMTKQFSRALRRRDVLGAIVLLAMAPAALASTDPAEAYVTSIANEVMRLANSGRTGNALRAQFSDLLNRYISLRPIADYDLGQYRSKIPAGKQAEFYQLVSNYAAALFVYYVADFRGNSLDIISNTQQGRFTVIQSAIHGSGNREQVRWRLVQQGGGYKVSDVNLKGVWLTIAMKDRFTKVMTKSKGDYNALFDELRQAETW